MKPFEFLGDSLEIIRDFPQDARRAAGFQLGKVQRGKAPDNWKPMKTIGRGVNEIRVQDDGGTYRVIYIAKLADAVYVLHAFKKKSQKTPAAGLRVAAARLKMLLRTQQ